VSKRNNRRLRQQVVTLEAKVGRLRFAVRKLAEKLLVSNAKLTDLEIISFDIMVGNRNELHGDL
jgi:hypothetical protein